jgi:hypothetical protein
MNSKFDITMVAALESGYASTSGTVSKERREIVIQHR